MCVLNKLFVIASVLLFITVFPNVVSFAMISQSFGALTCIHGLTILRTGNSRSKPTGIHAVFITATQNPNVISLLLCYTKFHVENFCQYNGRCYPSSSLQLISPTLCSNGAFVPDRYRTTLSGSVLKCWCHDHGAM